MSQYTTVDGYKFDAQINYGWGLTLNMTGKAPEVSKRIFDTYENMMYYVNDYNDSCIEGLTLTVMADGEKNGVYFVDKIGTNKPEVNENGEVVLDDEGKPVLTNTFANDGHVIKLGGAEAATEGIAGVQSALDAEIAARKAVDGQNGQTYVANESSNYIKSATSLNDADIKLDAAIKANADAITILNGGDKVEGSVAKAVADAKSAIEGELGTDDAKTLESINDELNGLDSKVAALENDKSFVKKLTVNGVDATIANNKATVTIDGSDIKLSSDYVLGDYSEVAAADLTPVTVESSIDAAISTIEGNIVKLTKEVISNEEVCAAAITKLNEQLGFNENEEFVPCDSSQYINAATSISHALCILDSSLKNVSDAASSNLSAAVEALDSTVTSENGKLVNITVVEEDGMLTSALVDETKLSKKISDIEEAIETASAAATTEVVKGTTNPMLSVTKDETAADDHVKYIIDLADSWDCGTFEYTEQ